MTRGWRCACASQTRDRCGSHGSRLNHRRPGRTWCGPAVGRARPAPATSVAPSLVRTGIATRRSASETAWQPAARDCSRSQAKPSTPASKRGARSPALPGTALPQKPTSTNERPAAAWRFIPNEETVAVASAPSGVSTIVVTPPTAAARVSVSSAASNPWRSGRSGGHAHTWVSTIPGSIARSPASSSGQPAGTSSKSTTPMTLPLRTWTEAGRSPRGVTTWRLRITRSGRNTSEADEIQLDLLVTVVTGPDVKRRPGNLVDERDRQPESPEVDGLEIVPTALTGVDAQVIVVKGMEVTEFVLVLFAALCAQDPPERPRTEAGRAEQPTAAPVARRRAERVENRQLRSSAAERAAVRRRRRGSSRRHWNPFDRRHTGLGEPMRVGLKDGFGKELTVGRFTPVGQYGSPETLEIERASLIRQRLRPVRGDVAQQPGNRFPHQREIPIEGS